MDATRSKNMKGSAPPINESRKRKFVEESGSEADTGDLPSRDTQEADDDFVSGNTYVSEEECDADEDCYDSDEEDDDPTRIVVDNQEEVLEEILEEDAEDVEDDRAALAYLAGDIETDEPAGMSDFPILKNFANYQRRARFILLFHTVLTALVAEAGLIHEKYKSNADWVTRASMTMSFWSFLLRANAKWLEDTLLKYIPDKVKLILGRTHWTLDDLLQLPIFAINEERPGDYLNILVDLDGRIEIYVGQAGRLYKEKFFKSTQTVQEYGLAGLGARWANHRSTARSKNEGRTKHHKALQKPGVMSYMRLLAVCPYGTPPAYHLLTETIYMIILGSYDYGKLSPYNTVATQQLYKTIRDLGGFPAPIGDALNHCLSVRQGLPKSKGPRECQCCKTAKSRRKWFNALSDQPFGMGGYLCEPCRDYKAKHGKDRPLELQERKEARDKMPEIPKTSVCGNCGIDLKDAKAKPHHRNHKHQMWLCAKCGNWSYTHDGGLRPTTGEELRAVFKPTGGEESMPTNCAWCPTELGARKRFFSKEHQVWLCLRCHKWANKYPGHKWEPPPAQCTWCSKNIAPRAYVFHPEHEAYLCRRCHNWSKDNPGQVPP